MPYFANGTQISEEELRMLLVVDVGNTNIVAGVKGTLALFYRPF